MSLDTDLERALRAALGDALLTDPADCLAYGYDNSRIVGRADAVALPRSGDQVAAIVRACRAARTPIVARGRGTNTTGASVPSAGGVVVSFERMRRIIEIDATNRLAVVEAGALNGDLQRALAPHGFFWAPDPTSADYASIGGNLACNAGGPRTVKYGACRENVLALSAVTGSGARLATGSRTTKGAVGYDLTRLLIGSEGTLALIVEATLKLTPLPAARASVRACFASVAAAADAVAALMAQPTIPSALEFLDGSAADIVARSGVAVPEGAGALLLIEVDGDSEQVRRDQATVARVIAQIAGVIAIDIARDEADNALLWQARKALSPALRALKPGKINEDVVVPVASIAALLARLEVLAKDSGVTIVNFGHAGNGNIHVNLLYDPADAIESASAHALLPRVFDAVIAEGGTLSGEHGIGLAKRAFMRRAVDGEALALMASIKRAFDPDGILNPGKLLPD